jgi:ABC-2 type transport system permease protein
MKHTLHIHLLEIKYEFLKLWRMPQYALPTILFPLIFYVFFGVMFGARQGGGMSMATYMLASYGAFGFGVTVAIERGQGWLQVKRTTPMPLSAYFVAKMAMAMLFSAAVVAGLLILAFTAGHVHLTAGRTLSLAATLIAGAITFSALGLAIGYFAGPNSAAPIVNLIYLPMSFLSGLWVPIWALPKGLQKFAFVLPPFHFSQLALKALGGGRGLPAGVHIVAMLIATTIFLAIAYSGYRRDEGRMFG